MSKILILDTETTGLHAPQACEIAYFPMPVSFSDFKLKLKDDFESNFDFKSKVEFDFVFNQRFKPNKKIDPQAAKITGISDETVRNCPGIDTFSLPEETKIIIGHNITYDHKVLSYKDLANPIPVQLICTKELAQLAFQKDNTKNNKLVTLIEHFYPEHIEMLQFAHGAYQDCLFVYMILHKILERLPKIDSWEGLVALCSQGKKSYEELSKLNEVITVMPFGKHKGTNMDEVPKDYLIWLSKQDNLSPALENAIKLQLNS